MPSARTRRATPRSGASLGCQKEAAFAADRVIVVVEELVTSDVIRADPNRTLIPGLIVDAVVVEPFGAHPSYTQGYYDRDSRFYVDWDAISRERGDPGRVAGRVGPRPAGPRGLHGQLGPQVAARIRPTGSAPSGSVDYGST